jgi:hypothetical protein
MTDKKKPYYGPAGIFSTDNPQSDRMQIEAEEYDEDEYRDRDDDVDDYEYADEEPPYYVFTCETPQDPADRWISWEQCYEFEGLMATKCWWNNPIR